MKKTILILTILFYALVGFSGNIREIALVDFYENEDSIRGIFPGKTKNIQIYLMEDSNAIKLIFNEKMGNICVQIKNGAQMILELQINSDTEEAILYLPENSGDFTIDIQNDYGWHWWGCFSF